MVGRSRPDLLGIRSMNSLFFYFFCSRTRSEDGQYSRPWELTTQRPAEEALSLLPKRHRAGRNCFSRNPPATHIDKGVWGAAIVIIALDYHEKTNQHTRSRAPDSGSLMPVASRSPQQIQHYGLIMTSH